LRWLIAVDLQQRDASAARRSGFAGQARVRHESDAGGARTERTVEVVGAERKRRCRESDLFGAW
jgi:hypothetical protein